MAFVFRKKFYVSDTHFGHDLMLTACGRPFSTTDEMDEHLIGQWNSVVAPTDIVHHLGDFSMNLRDENRVRSIFDRLNGSKILILGNHDYQRANKLHPTIARLDWLIAPVQAYETTDHAKRVYLSHYQHRTWPGQHKGGYHFFGHSHGTVPGVGLSRDVGVDMPDVRYRPRTFAELTQNMEA